MTSTFTLTNPHIVDTERLARDIMFAMKSVRNNQYSWSAKKQTIYKLKPLLAKHLTDVEDFDIMYTHPALHRLHVTKTNREICIKYLNDHYQPDRIMLYLG